MNYGEVLRTRLTNDKNKTFQIIIVVITNIKNHKYSSSASVLPVRQPEPIVTRAFADSSRVGDSNGVLNGSPEIVAHQGCRGGRDGLPVVEVNSDSERDFEGAASGGEDSGISSNSIEDNSADFVDKISSN